MKNNVDNLSCIVLSTLAVGKSAKQMHVLQLFDSAEQFWYEIDSRKNELINMVGENGYLRIKYSLNEQFVNSVLVDLERDNIIPVCYYDDEYPETLKNIYDPPLVLYCKGDISLLKSPCFAVVGTRKASTYGKKSAELFTRGLCKHFTIVSGLAYGIDTVAHETTLQEKGKTIAVLGSGLKNVYPSSNRALAQSIVADGGLVISEHKAYEEPNPYNFPMRNRIIAGLSQGVLVAEAPQKSGTLSTIEYALDYGIGIYVVPGDIFSPNYKGSNEIIKNMQGCLVTSPSDIICEEKFVKNPKTNIIQLDLQEQMVVDLLRVNTMHFDDIVKQSKISVSELNYLLSCLELKGIITRQAGNMYQYTSVED